MACNSENMCYVICVDQIHNEIRKKDRKMQGKLEIFFKNERINQSAIASHTLFGWRITSRRFQRIVDAIAVQKGVSAEKVAAMVDAGWIRFKHGDSVYSFGRYSTVGKGGVFLSANKRTANWCGGECVSDEEIAKW